MRHTDERIPSVIRSRQLAVPVAALGLIADGLGVFLADDVAGDVQFFDNCWVWVGLLHAAFCVGVAVCMGYRDWAWRAVQMGIASLTYWALAYLLLSSYVGLALYSEAPEWTRAAMLGGVIAYHGWWVLRIVRWYRSAWQSESLRRQIYVEQEDHILYCRSGESEVRKRLGIKFFPSNPLIVASLVLLFGSYFFRHDLIQYFGTPWVPIAIAIGGFALSASATSLVTMAVLLYFVYPRILTRQTGKPVYIDLLSHAHA